MNKQIFLGLAVAIGLTLLGYFGIIGFVLQHDTYLLSSAIALYVLGCFIYGFFNSEYGKRHSEVSITAGLLGTIVGLSVGIAAAAASGAGIDAIKGAWTAYHTTAVGLIGAMLLRIQFWFDGGAD